MKNKTFFIQSALSYDFQKKICVRLKKIVPVPQTGGGKKTFPVVDTPHKYLTNRTMTQKDIKIQKCAIFLTSMYCSSNPSTGEAIQRQKYRVVQLQGQNEVEESVFGLKVRMQKNFIGPQTLFTRSQKGSRTLRKDCTTLDCLADVAFLSLKNQEKSKGWNSTLRSALKKRCKEPLLKVCSFLTPSPRNQLIRIGSYPSRG